MGKMAGNVDAMARMHGISSQAVVVGQRVDEPVKPVCAWLPDCDVARKAAASDASSRRVLRKQHFTNVSPRTKKIAGGVFNLAPQVRYGPQAAPL